MRRILTLFLLVMALGTIALGQQGNTVTIQTTGAPTGSCSGIMRAVDISNNLQYFCSNATWYAALGNGNVTCTAAGVCNVATSISTGTAPTGLGTMSGVFSCKESTTAGSTPTAGEDWIHCNSSLGGMAVNNGTAGDMLIGRTVAAGTAALGTSAIASGACATVVQETTVTAGAVANVATTDAIVYTPNADPTAVTGYAVSATGSLYIWAYPTAGHVNFKVCNNTSGSLTPAALTLNWRVAR